MIIDGKKESALLKDLIKKEISDLKNRTNKTPSLTVILIGDYPPSQIYVKNKEKSSKEVGIISNVIKYPKDVHEKEIFDKISFREYSIDIICFVFVIHKYSKKILISNKY